MADIKNVRDLTIQAQLPRLVPISLPGNVTVPTTNVQGLPDYYSAAKQVVLRATTQVFKTTTVGGTSPSNIIITADVRNILGAVTWAVLSGTVNYTTGASTLTIQAGGLTTQSARIQASVTSDGVTYTDIITIINTVQGSGEVVGFLTNESSVVPAMANGVVLSYDSSGGQFRVFSSEIDVTGTAVTYSVVSSTSVNISIDATGTFVIDNLTLDTGSGILQASYGGTSIQRSFVVKKVAQILNGKDGQDGTNGANGANGVRGNVNIAVATTGTIWSDAAAAAGIAAAGFGTPKSRDIVTLYNTGSNFSQSKFYDGAAWLSLDAYINGNLLVTGSVFADKVDTRNLTIKDSDGNVILGAGAQLDGKTYIRDASVSSAKIENLAVSLAKIDTASIDKLSSLSAIIGLLRTTDIGQRTEIDNNGLRSYDVNGNLRVRVGVW